MTFWNNRAEPQEEDSELSPHEIAQLTGSSNFQQSSEDTVEEVYKTPIQRQVFVSPALLRLEQGKLYQMLIEHDLFADVEAHPQAVENVQNELKDFITARLEIMLGMRNEGDVVRTETQVFTSTEIEALKTLAKKMTEGLSKKIDEPKTGNLTPVGAEKAKAMLSPMKKTITKQPQPTRQAPQAQKPLPRKAFTSKREVTEEDLIERNKQINTKQAYPESSKPLPQLTADQATIHYQQIQSSFPKNQQLVNAVLNAKKLSGVN